MSRRHELPPEPIEPDESLVRALDETAAELRARERQPRRISDTEFIRGCVAEGVRQIEAARAEEAERRADKLCAERIAAKEASK